MKGIKHRNLARVFLAASIFIFGCSPQQVRQDYVSSLRSNDPVRTNKVEPEARNLFYQAERAFNSKNYDQAIKSFGQVIQRFPRGKAAMLSSYRIGMIYYYREDYPRASKEFEGFLARYAHSDLAFDVTYNLAASEYQQSHYEKAYGHLSRLKWQDIQAQGPKRAEVVYQLLAQSAAALGNHVAAISAHASQMQLPIEETSRNDLDRKIDTHLTQVSRRTDLERLLADVTEPVTRAKIESRLSAIVLAESQATNPITNAMPLEPLKPDHGPASLITGTTGNKNRIGVILPLTGKWGKYGEKALDGILLAAHLYQKNRKVDVELFIEDSASSPIAAEQAVDELVNKQKVFGIIGPLNWRESQAVADKAQELGVVNLSLSAKEGISARGPYLFQNALTPRVQLNSLVRNCIQKKGFKRFAILAPKNSFGVDMANEFWDLVELNGGRVVAYQTFPSGEKDFQSHIQELTGLIPVKFRINELNAITKYVKDVLKPKPGKEPKIRLQSLVDFDALFVPDSPKTLAQIAPSLAYYDVTNLPLLGTTEWTTEQLKSNAGKLVEGAIFPAGLNINSRSSRQREFIKMFAEGHGRAPDLLTGQAFEAVEILLTALQRTGTDDRNELARQMAGEFETTMGRIRFNANRLAERELEVVTFRDGASTLED